MAIPQGPSPYVAKTYNAQPAQFGGARQQPGAPKFGIADGGLLSVSCACATCCAAPIAIPAIILGLIFGGKKILNMFRKK